MCTSGFRNLRATNLPGPAKYPAMESPLSTWDVFHGDRLELERGLSAAAIREALARGDLRDDDLVRPAGTTVAWARLAELSEVLDSTPTPSDQPASPPTPFPTHAAATDVDTHHRLARRLRDSGGRLRGKPGAVNRVAVAHSGTVHSETRFGRDLSRNQ